MKKTTLSWAVALFIAGISFTGCDTPAEKVENAEEQVTAATENLDVAKEEYKTDLENYRRETAITIAANDQLIIDFNAQIAADKKTANAAEKKAIAELTEKNAEMKKKMDDYKEDGKDKWIAFKAEFSHDMAQLGDSFKDFTVKNTDK